MKRVSIIFWPSIFLMGATVLATAGTQDTPAPPPLFRVVNYEIEAEVIPDQKSLSATALLTIKAQVEGVRSVRLFLHDEFVVSRVTENDRALTFSRPKDSTEKPMFSPTASPLDIDLGRSLADSESVPVEIIYAGPIRGLINNVNLISESLTELACYCGWFPLEKENGEFTYGLRLTLPAGHVSVTDGRLIEEKAVKGKVVRVYRRETKGYDIPVVAGAQLKIQERKEGAITARVVYQDLDGRAAADSLDGAIRCAADLTRILGEPTSGGEVVVVYSPRSGWGYSRSPLIIGSETVLGERLSSQAGRRENFHGLAHEAAHFWWNLARTATSDDWINEALAEYFAIRSVGNAYGEPAAEEIWRDHFWQVQSLPPDKTILGTLRNDPKAYLLFYQKGSSLFRMLEASLGRDELDSILKAFYKENRGRRDATTDVFLALFRCQTGNRYDAFFDRYLRSGGLPELGIEWTASGRTTTGKVVVKDVALAGFPLTLAFRGEEKRPSETRAITLAVGENPWRFDLPFQPLRVSADPASCLLCLNADGEFAGRLTSLVHGPDMDFYPATIPKANLEKAAAIIAEWEKEGSGGTVLDFERGWLLFLKQNPPAALQQFTKALAAREELPNKKFYVPAAYRLAGLCSDLLNDRLQAVRFYKNGIDAADALGISKATQAALFQNYRNVPYPRGLSIHIAAGTGRLDEVVSLVAEAPTAVNAKDDFLGLPPVLWAVRTLVRRPVVEWLVEHGADVNVKDGSGQSLLSIVKAKGEAELAAFLVARGAKE